MKAFAALTALLVLTACGGGGSSSAPQDNTQAIAQQAIKNISDSTPAPKVYTGAFVIVESTPQGFISGKSDTDIVTRLAQVVVDGQAATPVKWADYYRLLLSATGLHITVLGDSTGVNQFGMATHAPDTVYTVRLTANGLVISQ